MGLVVVCFPGLLEKVLPIERFRGVGARLALHRKGIRVPDDVSIIGVDDQAESAQRHGSTRGVRHGDPRGRKRGE